VVIAQGAELVAAVLCAGGAVQLARKVSGAGTPPSYRGVLTFSTPGNGDLISPEVVQELDLATGQVGMRFNGLDASRTRNGETVFLKRLAGGYYADHGIVVADPFGVPGAPVYVCRGFSWSSNRACGTPKLAPNGRLVAFAAVSGCLCHSSFGVHSGVSVSITSRRGQVMARFEGYANPEWLPDGRLLMMGTQCRNAGVWITDTALQHPSRIDNDQITTPAGAPAVSRDGRRLAFVWNNQLWSLALVGQPELIQLTRMTKSVTSAAWSPDGKALAVLQNDVSMPVRSVVLLRPGDQSSMVVHQLPVYPYGPLSWC
jgi:hypothetical protein